MQVCVLGSTNVDLVLEVPRLPGPGETLLSRTLRREAGGKGANQACTLARMGAVVRFVSAVGADDGGRWSLDQLAAEGIDVREVPQLTGVPTGTAVVLLEPSGENVIVVASGANDHVRAPTSWSGTDVVLLSLEVPLATVTTAAVSARAAGLPVVLNAAPAQPLPSDLLSCTDVLVVNESELLALGGDPAVLHRAGPEVVVVTQGAAGCLVLDRRGPHLVPARAVPVVDTTGAGDCFVAALTYGIGCGWSIERSASLAVTAAGHAVGAVGARGGLPSRGTLAAELQ